ncbi:MAG: hypothetical protein QOD36_4138 [Mycobacterium sp.]|nr:hypothetical protein [Mycobacterium sp.]
MPECWPSAPTTRSTSLGATLELDPDPPVGLRQGAHRVAEHRFYVVAHRVEQDAHQIVAHDFDLPIAARLAHRPQRHIVGAPAVGTHRQQAEDLRAEPRVPRCRVPSVR